MTEVDGTVRAVVERQGQGWTATIPPPSMAAAAAAAATTGEGRH